MSISIHISPEKAVQAGAHWRVLDGCQPVGDWLDSGSEATQLAPRFYEIEFAPIPGWKAPQRLKTRNVDGFTNSRDAVYSPLSCYTLGEIPPQTAWHGQSLEFMLPPDQARMIQVRCKPQPLSQPCLDHETGIFRYSPDAEDKFPFLVTLSYNQGKKTQTFEITPMPLLPPEVDVFRDNPSPSEVAPSTLPVAPSALIPPDASLEQGQETPAAVPTSYSLEERIGPSAFLDILPAPQLAATRAMAFSALIAETEKPGSDLVEYDDEPVIDVAESEEEVLFNAVKRKTNNIRIIGENLKFEKGRMEYDQIHEHPDIKRLDIYAETVTICNPLHLPQTTVSIYARELRFEGDGQLRTEPETYNPDTTPAPKARQIPATDSSGNIKKDSRGREMYSDPEADGDPGEHGGNITLHIESYQAPDRSQKRFVLIGGRGQDPGEGLKGNPGITRDCTSSWHGAEMGSRREQIVYGIYRSILYWPFEWEQEVREFGRKEWPLDGGNATPPGIPGPGGTGGTLTATLDLASQADVAGGAPGTANRTVYEGGSAGNPEYSVMVESRSTKYAYSGYGGLSWRSLDHPGWTEEGFFEGKRMFIHKTEKGLDAVQETIGSYGRNGEVICRGHPLSWLHPLLLKEILKRAKDRYLMGEFESVQDKLTEYAELLDIYQSLKAWKDLDESDQQELYSIRSQIAELIFRLHNQLDYFGNPAGWVPMLSFEVNQTIFDNEIDRAFEILYLTYWLQKKAQDTAKRDQALKKMEEKLKEEIEDLQKEYAQVTEAFPELEREATEISKKIIELQKELQNLEGELRRTAEEQLNPWWKTGLKIAGTLLSVVPVYQPALGAVGGVVNLFADFDQDDPWKTVTGAANIAKTFADARFTQTNTAFENELNLLKVKDSPDGKSKLEALQAAKNLQKYTNAFSKGAEGVAKVLAERQVPQSEVDALLQKLTAESPEFKRLSSEISTQLERNREFAQQTADALQQLADIPNVITSNLLAIDSIHSAQRKAENALHDGRLTQHLESMERRAQERLLKYHYYLAKSYEYRLLKPYTQSLNLEAISDKLLGLAELNMKDDHPYELSKDQFDALKGIYRDKLSSIAEEIVETYQHNQPELTTKTRFSLTDTEIQRLNAGESIMMNLVDLGLFKLSEENVRINNLEVESLAVSGENSGKRNLMEVDLRFEHSGISQLRSAGRAIAFRHPARETTNPIAWGARYDVIDKKLDPIKPSEASDSLLRSLLNEKENANSMMLYSRPAAWADLNVFREVIADSGIPAPVIKALRLQVTYDFTRRSPGIIVLDIKALAESTTKGAIIEGAILKPYFRLDRKDINERQDGRGAFYRAYYKSGLDVVQIMAPDHYGQWKFNRWEDQARNLLGMTPCLEAKLSTDLVIKAVYKFAG